MKHGKGKMALNDDTYEGDFVNDVREGQVIFFHILTYMQGTYRFLSYLEYTGAWKND